jgi:RNA polymerase primary sigma factor
LRILYKILRKKYREIKISNYIVEFDDIEEVKNIENSTAIQNFLGITSFSKQLSPKEESEVVQLLDSPDPEKKKYAIERLTSGNLKLVISNAKYFMNTGVDFIDLINEGLEGLIKSIEKFD